MTECFCGGQPVVLLLANGKWCCQPCLSRIDEARDKKWRLRKPYLKKPDAIGAAYRQAIRDRRLSRRAQAFAEAKDGSYDCSI